MPLLARATRPPHTHLRCRRASGACELRALQQQVCGEEPAWCCLRRVSAAGWQPAQKCLSARQACRQAQRCAGHVAMHAWTACLPPPHGAGWGPLAAAVLARLPSRAARGLLRRLLLPDQRCAGHGKQLQRSRALSKLGACAAGSRLLGARGRVPQRTAALLPGRLQAPSWLTAQSCCVPGAQGSTPSCSTAPSSSPRWAPASRRRCSPPWLCAPNAAMAFSCVSPCPVCGVWRLPQCCSASIDYFHRACSRQAY